MNPLRLSLSPIPFTLVLLLAVAGLNASAGAPSPITDKRILIKAVDVKAGTIQIQYMRDPNQVMYVYKIDSFTVLKVNNVKGTIDQVKVGMQVRDFVERDFEALDSISVDMADPPPYPTK